MKILPILPIFSISDRNPNTNTRKIILPIISKKIDRTISDVKEGSTHIFIPTSILVSTELHSVREAIRQLEGIQFYCIETNQNES